jgi:SAM-dependent methyltransferase
VTALDGAVRGLIRINKRMSKSVAPVWRHTRFNIFEAYDEIVAAYAGRAGDRPVIADVGAGNRCPYRMYLSEGDRVRIVGVDVSTEAMRENPDLDERRVADVVVDLPFADGEVDLLVSRSVLEHLSDVEAFVRHSARVLRPGAHSIHVFPSRYAHFALINRLIPNAWTKRVMRYVYPKNVSGFPAFYDRCYYTAMREVFDRNGFDVVEARISYYASDYYTFFFPLFVVSMLYEIVIWSLNAKNLGATVLIVARKRPEGDVALEAATRAA